MYGFIFIDFFTCKIFISGIECYKPANGETVTIETHHNIPVDISLSLLKREASFAGKLYRYLFVKVEINNEH
jgi:hypothetical protein